MRKYSWALLLLLLLSACTALADSGELAVDGGFIALAAQGNTVYLLDGESHLFIVEAGQAFPETPACTLSRETDFLLTDQGILYGWESITGALFRIDVSTGEASDERLVGTADVFEIRDGYTESEFYVPMLHEGTFTVHWEGPYNWQGLVRFAPGGTPTYYDLNGDGTLIHGDPDGRIIAVPDWCGQKELGQLDVETEDFTWFRTLPLDTWGIASQGEKVYIGAGNYIEQYDSIEATDGQIVACLPRTAIDLGNQSMKILDGGWVALISHGTFYLQRLEVNQGIRELTLSPAFYSGWDQNAAFLSEYPDVALRFADWWMLGPSNKEDYAQALTDLEADILDCPYSYTLWQEMKDEGYAADLSASALLAQAISDMYPAYRDACTREGKVVGIPYAGSLDWTTQQISKTALLEHTGLTDDQLPESFLDLPETLNHWLAQSPRASFDGEPLDRSVAHKLCEAFIEQYIAFYEGRGEPLFFDTPLFRAGLALRDQVPDLPSAAKEGAWHNVVTYGGASFSPSQAPSILPLSLDAEHPYTLQITLNLMFVNPNSPNQDVAIAYLESAIQSMPPQRQVLWTPGDWQPLLNPDYEATLAAFADEIDLLHAKIKAFEDGGSSWLESCLSRAEKQAASFAEHGRWLLSPDFLQAYTPMANNMVVYEQDFFETGRQATLHTRSASSLRAQYMNGEIDADTLIVRLQLIADRRGKGME